MGGAWRRCRRSTTPPTTAGRCPSASPPSSALPCLPLAPLLPPPHLSARPLSQSPLCPGAEQREPSALVARPSGQERERARHPAAEPPRRGRGQALLPETAEEDPLGARGARHRQAPLL